MLSFGPVIGRGGFCEVVLAKHLGTNSQVAVKIYQHLKDNEEQRSTLRREVDILKRLRNPHVISYYGCLTDRKDDQLYVLMEYCDGGSAFDMLRRARSAAAASDAQQQPQPQPLSEAHIAYILRCTLLALQYLHSANIVHRDVKAANILLSKSGEVRPSPPPASALL